jgi:hypothetical protein
VCTPLLVPQTFAGASGKGRLPHKPGNRGASAKEAAPERGEPPEPL